MDIFCFLKSGQLILFQASQKTWELSFFQPLFPSIARACRNLIRIHRDNNSFVDVDLIRKTVEIFSKKIIFVDFHCNVCFVANEDFNVKMKKILKNDSDIYQMYLQSEIIRDAEDFYRQQTTPISESNSMVVYFTAVRFDR